MSSRYFFDYIKIAVIYLLPMVWWYSGLLTPEFAWTFAWLNLGLLGVVIVLEKWTWEELGFKTNTYESFKDYLVSTIALSMAFVVFALLLGRQFEFSFLSFLKFALPIAFLQEFAYRGYLIPKLQSMKLSRTWTFVLSFLLFIIPHLIYTDLLFAILFSLISGIYFVWIYLKHPNMFLITLSHAILLWLGSGFHFFSFQ